MGAVECGEDVFGLYVEAVDVVEEAVICFGNDRERPGVADHTVLDSPGDHGVADDADGVRVGDGDGTCEEAGFFDPGGSGHFAVAVEGEPSSVDGVFVVMAAREDGGDSGAHGSFADFERAAPGDEGGGPDFDAGDVGDGVEWARLAVEGDAELAGAGLGWLSAAWAWS